MSSIAVEKLWFTKSLLAEKEKWSGGLQVGDFRLEIDVVGQELSEF